MPDDNDLLFDILRNGGTVMDVPTDAEGNPDGEAFCRSLKEAFDSIPPVWVRKQNDPEWSKPNAVSVNQVVGAMLEGVMKSCGEYQLNAKGPLLDDEVPEDLTDLARFLKCEMTHNYPAPHFDRTVFSASLCDLGSFIWSRIQEGKWFNERTCAPDIAIHNGLIALRTDLREDARFEERFAAKMGAEIAADNHGLDGEGI